jgi:hypothetical protein
MRLRDIGAGSRTPVAHRAKGDRLCLRSCCPRRPGKTCWPPTLLRLVAERDHRRTCPVLRHRPLVAASMCAPVRPPWTARHSPPRKSVAPPCVALRSTASCACRVITRVWRLWSWMPVSSLALPHQEHPNTGTTLEQDLLETLRPLLTLGLEVHA